LRVAADTLQLLAVVDTPLLQVAADTLHLSAAVDTPLLRVAADTLQLPAAADMPLLRVAADTSQLLAAADTPLLRIDFRTSAARMGPGRAERLDNSVCKQVARMGLQGRRHKDSRRFVAADCQNLMRLRCKEKPRTLMAGLLVEAAADPANRRSGSRRLGNSGWPFLPE